jgi:hypothetical protein
VKIVLFIDDLDRCLEGRNVRVLEAVQLLLKTDGAPVLVVLAVDTRVVAASIEATFNKSLNIHDAEISGQEYLDKIIQLPFCIPEVSPDRIKAYIHNCTSRPVKHSDIVRQLTDLIEFADGVSNELRDTQFGQESNDAKKEVFLNFSDREALEDSVLLFNEFHESVKEYLDKKGQSNEDDVIFIKMVGKQMNNSTRRAVTKFELEGEKGTEELYHSLLDAISAASVKIIEAPLRIEGSQEEVGKNKNISQSPITNTQGDWEKNIVCSISDKNVSRKIKSRLSRYMEKKRRYNSRQLISIEMRDLVSSLSSTVGCDPRSVKRVLNVLQVILEVAKVMHINEENPTDVVVDDKHWPDFSRKIAIWVFLCEAFPFRLSFLIHRLRDFIHKRNYNNAVKAGRRITWYSRGSLNADTEDDGDSLPIRNIYDNISLLSEICYLGSVPVLEQLSINEFYYRYVESYIYALENYHKHLHADGDPTEFALVLSRLDSCTDGNSGM